jgi:hypothetical protein
MPKNTMERNAEAGTGAGGTGALTLPPGFTAERNPFYSEAIGRRFDMLPPKAGAVRVLLVTWKEIGHDQVRGILGNPRFALKRKAPWIYEATLLSRDMEQTIGPNVGTGKTFRWVDIGTRLFGVPCENPTDMVSIAVASPLPEDEVKRKLKSFGVTLSEAQAPEGDEGDWVNPDEGLLTGTIPGGKLYDLVLWEKATAIEMRGVEKVGRTN